MSKITVTGKLRGTVQAPPSKSVSHRALIAAALAGGESVITNLAPSDDILATEGALRAMGAELSGVGATRTVQGLPSSEGTTRTVSGLPSSELAAMRHSLPSLPTPTDKHSEKSGLNEICVDCGESGSTLRFLIPILAAFGWDAVLTGRGRLGQRPLTVYAEIWLRQGLVFAHSEDSVLPLRLGGQLQPGVFPLRGDISSQFLSGLCFALPLLDGDSEIVLTTALISAPYLELTLSVLRDFGIEIEYAEGRLAIKGRQTYQPRPYQVESDYSQAAFWLTAAALGSAVSVTGLDPHSVQGDRYFLELLPLFRPDPSVADADGVVRVIDMSGCPDLVPILSLLAALTPGVTEIQGAATLRLKESDRLSAISTELGTLGAKITEQPDGLRITGVPRLHGGRTVCCHNDHRIAMTLAIAATVCDEPLTLDGWECVSKSYPNFFDEFAKLGGTVQSVD